TGHPDHVIEEHAQELRRYLVMCAVTDGSLPMAGPVDELWHEFMLHSQTYAKFCEKVAGRYLHHAPAAKLEPRDIEADAKLWGEFRDRYLEAFDEEPPAHIWPHTDSVEVGSRQWWERRLDRVANGNETQAFLWWSSDSTTTTSTSGTGDIAQCTFTTCASTSGDGTGDTGGATS
ncbi:MAG: hypothetical protein R6X23_06050, partial [Acidimicrobiia bacterium]